MPRQLIAPTLRGNGMSNVLCGAVSVKTHLVLRYQRWFRLGSKYWQECRTQQEHQMTTPDPGEGQHKPKARRPRKVTKERLRNIALHHLQRYATSSHNLKRVLERRVFKAARHHETDLEQARTWIDEVVDALVRTGAVDDSQYAQAKTLTMLRRGQSPAKVRSFLVSKGVSSIVIAEALNNAEQTLGDVDLQAAQAYAARRRIGPYRTSEGTPEDRKKELAVLERPGFRYDIARKIVDADKNFD